MAEVEKLCAGSGYLAALSGEVRLPNTNVVGGSTYRATSVYGVEQDYITIKDWPVKEGEFFTAGDLEESSKVAVLGATVAKQLFGAEGPIGRSIRIETTPLTVVGVLESKGSTGMGNDQDDVVMVPPETAVNRLTKDRRINSIEMSVVSESVMSQAQTEVTDILRESHKIAAGATDDFNVMNQEQIIQTAFQTSQTLTTLLASIAGGSLIVGCIGIMNIMLVSVAERARETGIRISVGARRRDILLQFLPESVILSLLGVLVGNLLALLLAYGMQAFMNVPAIVSPAVIAASAGFAAVAGIFFGF